MTESLTLDELREIAGAYRKSRVIAWLESNRWQHSINANREPVVGRMYARYKLAGMAIPSAVEPKFNFEVVM